MLTKGWEAEIVISKIDDTTFGIVREEIHDGSVALSSGDILYTKLYPIVDNTGLVTDEESDIKIESYNGTTYTDFTTFTLTGADGKITLSGAVALDTKLYTSYNFKRTVGYAQGLELTVETELEPIISIGSRNARDIVPGTVSVTGNLDEFFVDRNLFEQAVNIIGEKLIPFDMEITNTKASGGVKLTLENVRFGTWNYDMTDDGFTANNCDFVAENMIATTI